MSRRFETISEVLAEFSAEYVVQCVNEALASREGEAVELPEIYEQYKTWPEDIKAKLSLHDLRRMTGWKLHCCRPQPAALWDLNEFLSDLESIEGCLEWVKSEDQTVNVGNASGEGEELIESSAGWITRLLTAILTTNRERTE